MSDIRNGEHESREWLSKAEEERISALKSAGGVSMKGVAVCVIVEIAIIALFVVL